jgi:hypothetical protein
LYFVSRVRRTGEVTMKKLLLALALLAFGLGPALADSPTDDNQGGGNDPPSQTGGGGGKAPGQTNNPNPSK